MSVPVGWFILTAEQVLGICVVILWCIVSFATAKNVVSGKLFETPHSRAAESASRETREKERVDA
jgi:hypothetical protein